MDSKQVIQGVIASAERVSTSYLADLSDADLLVRPVPGANHIAWQLGHLICSEHRIANAVTGNKMPPLPAGFAEKYTKETAKLDDPQAFHTKAEYLRIHQEQQQAFLHMLKDTPETDLDKPTPEPLKMLGPKLVNLWTMLGMHWMMHAGQWAVLRRKLGRAPLF
jgi:uncharacterized damage-inducible protein DinB